MHEEPILGRVIFVLAIIGGAIVFHIFGTPGWVSDGGDGILRFFTAGKFSLSESLYRNWDFMINVQEDKSFWHPLILWSVVCIICLVTVVIYLSLLLIGVLCIVGVVIGSKNFRYRYRPLSVFKRKPMPCQIN